MVIVFCTPNGWDAVQQGFLRNAAIRAGVVRDRDVDGRIDFITEGEASVHYALEHSKSNQWMRPGSVFAVADAGGSTVDSTLYECKSVDPLRLEEVCASECVQVCRAFFSFDIRSHMHHTDRQEEYLSTEQCGNS
jgi:hypothetical protein